MHCDCSKNIFLFYKTALGYVNIAVIAFSHVFTTYTLLQVRVYDSIDAETHKLNAFSCIIQRWNVTI